MAKHSKRDKYTGTLEAIQAKHAIAREFDRMREADAKDMERLRAVVERNALRGTPSYTGIIDCFDFDARTDRAPSDTHLTVEMTPEMRALYSSRVFNTKRDASAWSREHIEPNAPGIVNCVLAQRRAELTAQAMVDAERSGAHLHECETCWLIWSHRAGAPGFMCEPAHACPKCGARQVWKMSWLASPFGMEDARETKF
jgi:hypothetical protein